MSRYASLFKMISFLSLLSDVIAYITEPKLLTINNYQKTRTTWLGGYVAPHGYQQLSGNENRIRSHPLKIIKGWYLVTTRNNPFETRKPNPASEGQE
ncbi:hypothetical protein MGG_16346 [Pyricularia oryzae 70-15]|uniref:Secreted protein n=1 Tax=Pyricularia oryzae (strain 70-15 / ATCC MYA-4617 / FGSC 8958) TaxID=242507 RepID=G4MLA4_PYRO7|nr:uncharacterized protein MGG_16346 [Pyricularia oryzae 70-15]EHA57634.1 hypothetical protein MGG_16346 [Pyricularia oryzae 70-15]KAI7909244.1 hypothetical protein M0657_011928 [Pyricularia oryzae]KAI7910451.1 hypothetical protein M9X92_011105 [Pyricularia oryzae]